MTLGRRRIMRKILFSWAVVFVLMASSILMPASQEYEANIARSESEQKPVRGLTDLQDLEAFVDGIMTAHMRSYHIAGAVFAAVKDGRIFLAKGYGYADVSAKIPVSAAATMFRPGSVSKLFTWTAVMQLVEQGKIDLDTDVNNYLQGFYIPDTFPEPITMNHLLAHSPGFEEKGTGMGAQKAEDLLPLAEFLKEYMPARVRPPGQFISYSNYGTALAGYIVQIVSGVLFEDYVEENIFLPLGLKHSTFRQPLPKHLADDMSVGYDYRQGVYKAEEFELINGMAPAGSLSASAEDMAAFMIAHLQKGEYNGVRILEEETVFRMQDQLYTHDVQLDGNAHGFWEWTYNGVSTIGHGGDTWLFHSMLVLVPYSDTGFFVSYNSTGGGGPPRMELMRSLFDRYFPLEESENEESPSESNDDLRRYTGSYLSNRVNSSTFEKLGNLMSVIKVSETREDTLVLRSGASSSQWRPLEPLVFRKVGGQDLLLFRENENGAITHMFMGWAPMVACEKLTFTQTPGFHYFILGFAVFFMLSTFIWPVSAVRRKLCRCGGVDPDAPALVRLLAFIMSVVSLIFLLGLLILLSDPLQLMFGVPLFMKILLALPLAAMVPALAVFFFVFYVWIKKYWTWCGRVHYLLVFLSFLLFLWFLKYWNLLGYHF